MKDQIAEKYRKLLDEPGDLVIIDTETTGADKSRDYPVSIAIVNGFGDELMNALVRPPIPVSAGAAKVHGISEDELVNAPYFTDLYAVYIAATEGRTKLAYNSAFDSAMISNAKRQFLPGDPPESGWVCVMLDYAAFNGTPGRFGTPKWWKLTDACVVEGIEVVDAHDALGDVRMTLQLMQKMAGYSSQPTTPIPVEPDSLSKQEIQSRFVKIARLEESSRATIARLHELRDSVDKMLEALTSPPVTMRDDLKCDITSAIESGEDIDHSLVTVRTVKKWSYDRGDALAWAEKNEPEVVKTSLKVRDFEKLLRDPHLFDGEFPNAEQVETIVIALPADLSHVLIGEE